MEDKYLKANLKHWELSVDFHARSDFYNLENFKKGWNSLKTPELEALGDVSAKSLLHLQCHFGQDTLSWARLGAKVTGVDFSEKAVRLAKALNEELGLNANFICANVLDLKNYLDGQFDIVFTSYGTLGWLSNLEQWASVVNHFLAPGGTFYIVEFHPALMMLDFEKHQVQYPYFYRKEPDYEVTEGTYADPNSGIKTESYYWSYAVSEVITCLMKEGLQLESFQEFPFSPYNCFSNMDKIDEDQYVYNGTKFPLPHLYSLKFIKLK